MKNKEEEDLTNLDVSEVKLGGQHGVVAVAAALESVVPPLGHQDLTCIRHVRPKHVPESPHGLSQRLLLLL